MDRIQIEGIHGFNGEYPLDMSYFTTREYHLIKQISGVRAGEMADAFQAEDKALIMAVAVIMVWRDKKVQPPLDPFWDAQEPKFTLINDEESGEDDEDDGLPPKIAPVAPITPAGTPSTDGESSTPPSDAPAKDLRAIGAQG